MRRAAVAETNATFNERHASRLNTECKTASEDVVEFLEYAQVVKPNGSFVTGRSKVSRGQQHNADHHGTISGNITFHVGSVLHSYSFTRHAHATQKNHSCGFIHVEVDAKNAVNDAVFWKAFASRASVAAQRLQQIATLSHDDGPGCSHLRQHFFSIMRYMPSDKCSSFWANDPTPSVLQEAMALAEAYPIEVPESVTGLTRGHLWAIAVLNSATQLDEGYLKVLQYHLEFKVGFVIVQKRIWNHAEFHTAKRVATRRSQSAVTEGALYGHARLCDEIAQEALVIWPMSHIVDDGFELGDKNHFEVLTNQNKEESSLFFIDRLCCGDEIDERIPVPADQGDMAHNDFGGNASQRTQVHCLAHISLLLIFILRVTDS